MLWCSQSYEVKIRLHELAERYIFQRNTICRIVGNDDISTSLRSMGQHGSKAVENSIAKLDVVVTPTLCLEICYDVIAELRPTEHKSIDAATAGHDVVS